MPKQSQKLQINAKHSFLQEDSGGDWEAASALKNFKNTPSSPKTCKWNILSRSPAAPLVELHLNIIQTHSKSCLSNSFYVTAECILLQNLKIIPEKGKICPKGNVATRSMPKSCHPEKIENARHSQELTTCRPCCTPSLPHPDVCCEATVTWGLLMAHYLITQTFSDLAEMTSAETDRDKSTISSFSILLVHLSL